MAKSKRQEAEHKPHKSHRCRRHLHSPANKRQGATYREDAAARRAGLIRVREDAGGLRVRQTRTPERQGQARPAPARATRTAARVPIRSSVRGRDTSPPVITPGRSPAGARRAGTEGEGAPGVSVRARRDRPARRGPQEAEP